MDIKNEKLEMHDFFLGGDRNANTTKTILKARGNTWDIKAYKK